MLKLLKASDDKLNEVDRILDEVPRPRPESDHGPLLLSMTVASRKLGVSRPTLWRMIRAGKLQRVAILPGSFRVRRADIEAIAAGKEV